MSDPTTPANAAISRDKIALSPRASALPPRRTSTNFSTEGRHARLRANCKSLLTSRNREKGQPIPMCGVPYPRPPMATSRNSFRAGFKIAICDQMEQPRPPAKKNCFAAKVVARHHPGTAHRCRRTGWRAKIIFLGGPFAKHASGSPGRPRLLFDFSLYWRISKPPSFSGRRGL